MGFLQAELERPGLAPLTNAGVDTLEDGQWQAPRSFDPSNRQIERPRERPSHSPNQLVLAERQASGTSVRPVVCCAHSSPERRHLSSKWRKLGCAEGNGNVEAGLALCPLDDCVPVERLHRGRSCEGAISGGDLPEAAEPWLADE